MGSLTLIISMCTIMWYLIDNLKENFWGGLPYSRYITIAVATVTSLLLSFGFHLDLVYSLGLMAEISIVGQIVTALAMMGGSALVSELVEKFRKKI